MVSIGCQSCGLSMDALACSNTLLSFDVLVRAVLASLGCGRYWMIECCD